MTVQEQIENLWREKTPHPPEEMSRLAWERYAQIKERLERDHHGEFVMIEVDSGDYFVGESQRQAYSKAHSAYPDKAFHCIRIGYPAVRRERRPRRQ